MLDVGERCGPARAGRWTFGGGVLAVPNVLCYRSPRANLPEEAEVFLAAGEDGGPGIVFRESGSLYHAQPAAGELAIPAETPTAIEFEHLAAIPAMADGSRVAVLSAPASSLPEEVEVAVMANAVEYLRHPKAFVDRLVALRASIGTRRLLYVPGLATPGNLAPLAYAGVDLVDSLRALLEARQGRLLRPDGSWTYASLQEPVCACRYCTAAKGFDALAGHNVLALLMEQRTVRDAIRRGHLREIAERRAANDPWNTAVLRQLDLRQEAYLDEHTAVSGGSVLAYTAASLTRPEVVRYRRRVRERYAKPPSAQVLLLVPCAARKPYSISKSHKLFRAQVLASGNPWAVHVAAVTSPFGIVPSELELFPPIQRYDVPVTGDWSKDETAVVEEDLASFLERHAYRSVVVHLEDGKDLVDALNLNAIVTCRDDPTAPKALDTLKEGLSEAVEDLKPVGLQQRTVEDIASVARVQFGPDGEALADHAAVRGRYPALRVLRKGGGQVAMLTPERGMLSLTMDGGQVLSDRNVHIVEIEDFYPEGGVFAVGVTDADPRLRVGDEAIVRHAGEVRAVGVARMNGREMVEAKRGEAVRTRHRLKPAPAND